MIRVLIFIAIIALAAFGAVWLADRPGDVVVTWQGYRIETSLAVAAIGVVALAAALGLVWSVLRLIVNLPSLLLLASRNRRRAKGISAVTRGMIAVGAGDTNAARRHSAEAERMLGTMPLVLLLKAQTAQMTGDRAGADQAFTRMVEADETRVLGLRGLYVEALRRGETQAALAYAREAVRLAPGADWASEAVLADLCRRGDWAGARAQLDRRAALRLVDKAQARKGRAALLAADARVIAETDPDAALVLARQALSLNPGLTPAAALAGRLLARQNSLRRAARVLETAWQIQPHPDLASAYLDLRAGDSARDRLTRARRLLKLTPEAEEARLAVLETATRAGDFPTARTMRDALLAGRPTVRIYLAAADLAEAEHGPGGETREWLARAARAPRDPAWCADGIVSERWLPASPRSGALDPFVWTTPPDGLPLAPALDHDGAEAGPLLAAAPEAEPPAGSASSMPGPSSMPDPSSMPRPSSGEAPPASPATDAMPSAQPAHPQAGADGATLSSPATTASSTPSSSEKATRAARGGHAAPSAPTPEPIVAVPPPPDDPGPVEDSPEPPRRRFGLLG